MLVRYVLLLLLLLVIAYLVSRFVGGVLRGLAGDAGVAGGRRSATPPAVQMARDPVCGTYVVPGKALEMARGRETVFFCSEKCRNQYLEQR